MIDYEAAALMIHQLRNLGSPPKRLPDIDAAKRIVGAALGDTVLYCLEQHKTYCDDYEGATEFGCRGGHVERRYVQVWPEGDGEWVNQKYG